MNFLNKVNNLIWDFSVFLGLDNVNYGLWSSFVDVVWNVIEDSDWDISVVGGFNFFVRILLDNISEMIWNISVFGTGNLIIDSSWDFFVLALNNSIVYSSWCFCMF